MFGLSGIEMEFKFNFNLLFLLALITQGYTLQVPLTEASQRFFSFSNSRYSTGVLISGNTDKYVKTLLEKWGSSGLSVAVVRKTRVIRTVGDNLVHTELHRSTMMPDSVCYPLEQQTFPCDVSGPFDFQQNSG